MDNMDDLTPLNGASILENIRIRFRCVDSFQYLSKKVSQNKFSMLLSCLKSRPNLYANGTNSDRDESFQAITSLRGARNGALSWKTIR